MAIKTGGIEIYIMAENKTGQDFRNMTKLLRDFREEEYGVVSGPPKPEPPKADPPKPAWERPMYSEDDVQRRVREAVEAERRRGNRRTDELAAVVRSQEARIDRLVGQVIEAEEAGVMTRSEANEAIEAAIELERKQHPETTIVDGSHDRAFVVQPAKKEDSE